MSSSSCTGFPPAVILQIDQPQYPSLLHTYHICVVYGGENRLLFRCPCCGVIHSHGAGNTGGASDGATPSPHCTRDYSHFLTSNRFQWCLHELTEGMGISWAGNLDKLRKYICPRRPGEVGYDQLENGQLAFHAPATSLINAYKKKGVLHG